MKMADKGANEGNRCASREHVAGFVVKARQNFTVLPQVRLNFLKARIKKAIARGESYWFMVTSVSLGF